MEIGDHLLIGQLNGGFNTLSNSDLDEVEQKIDTPIPLSNTEVSFSNKSFDKVPLLDENENTLENDLPKKKPNKRTKSKAKIFLESLYQSTLIDSTVPVQYLDNQKQNQEDNVKLPMPKRLGKRMETICERGFIDKVLENYEKNKL